MFDPQDLNKSNLPQPAEAPTALLTPQQKRQLEEEQIASTKEILEEERVYRQGVVSVRDLISPAALEVTASHIKLGELFVRTVFVVQYP